jgi:cysteine desulfurase
LKKQIYLDYAAATPVDAGVLAAMQPYFTQRFYNPSATYDTARSVKKDVEAARAKVALVLGARSAEIIFTAGGTEANNLAVRGILEQFPGSNVVVSAIEHESVLAAAQLYDHKLAPVDKQGIVDVNSLVKLIDDKTVLVSVMYANNEVGTIQPIKDIAQALKAIRRTRQAKGIARPLYFHTDAAQAANYLDLHVSRLGVDLMTLNGGKIYGPKASGALFVASHVQLRPQILGGGQERGQRSGTENVAAIIGFAEALTLTQSLRHDEALRLSNLQKLFFGLLQEKIPGVVINGSLSHRLPNNLHLTIPGEDNERLLIELDEAGIIAAAGSACSASDEEPSHVLKAMGVSDADAQASLRLTMGRATDEVAVRVTVQTLRRLVSAKQ